MGVEDDVEGQARMAAFRRALQALGWTEDKNVIFDYRWASSGASQVRKFAKEPVDLRPDLIFSHSTPVTVAVKEVAGSIPIVFVQVSDPVVSGVVESLAKPGRNLTGFTNFEPSMSGKWLELLKAVAPHMVRVAFLFNPQTTPAFYRASVEGAAPLLSLKAVAAEVQSTEQIDRAISALALEPDGGLLVMPDIFTSVNRQRIIALAAEHRVPAIYTFKFFAVEGGLLSYGIDVLDVYRQAASYVDRVLRGVNPANLPVQAPTKFELVINLKTAKALRLEVPPSLLARADEVIE